MAAEFRLDELPEITVHDRVDVCCLTAGAVVFDHLVRLENVGPNLTTEADLTFLTVDALHLRAFFVLLDLKELALQNL